MERKKSIRKLWSFSVEWRLGFIYRKLENPCNANVWISPTIIIHHPLITFGFLPRTNLVDGFLTRWVRVVPPTGHVLKIMRHAVQVSVEI